MPGDTVPAGPRTGPAGTGLVGTGLAGALHDAGLRATRPRMAVYQALGSLGGHRSADEVATRIADDGTPLPRTSVYNALRVMADVGLVMIADTGSGPTLYEVSDEWHHHFVCRVCGAIIDVPCSSDDHPCMTAQVPGGGEIESAQIIFRGVCGACLAEGASPASAS